MASTRSQPVVIVGGGIIGLCAAYSLVTRGVDVCVVDRRTDIPPASWGNAGWIVPALSAPLPGPGVMRYSARALLHPESPLHLPPRLDLRLARWLVRFATYCTRPAHRKGFRSTIQFSRDAAERYEKLQRSGVQFDMWQQGLMVVALSRSAAETELARLRPLAEFGYTLTERALDGPELRAMEPALSSSVRAGFTIDEEHHVDPRSLLSGLERWLRAEGVTFLSGQPVVARVKEGSPFVGVKFMNDLVPASAVILAGGAWTSSMTAELGYRLPIQAGKGYSFLAEGVPKVSRPLKLLEAMTAITPFRSETRVAGTMEFDGLRLRVRPQRIAAIHTAARQYLDGWDGVSVEHPWAGVRPLSPDGLPVIGRIPGTRNAYVSTGHAMLGVTLGPATGDLLADLILTGSGQPFLEPFAPERFHGWRVQRRN